MIISTRVVALAATLVIVAGAPASAATRTTSSGNLHLAIKDRQATTSALRVRQAGTIKDIDVYVRINHGSDGDLDLFLISPKGKAIQLSTNNGGGGSNYGSGPADCTGSFTVFDDEASVAIYNAAASFVGPYKPEQKLSGLDGSSRKGTWRLLIGDDTANTVGGSLRCWKVRIKT